MEPEGSLPHSQALKYVKYPEFEDNRILQNAGEFILVQNSSKRNPFWRVDQWPPKSPTHNIVSVNRPI
jgi:hypothetical protein